MDEKEEGVCESVQENGEHVGSVISPQNLKDEAKREECGSEQMNVNGKGLEKIVEGDKKCRLKKAKITQKGEEISLTLTLVKY